MPAYTPPPPPHPTGNPITDVQLAFAWTSQFFTVRAPTMRIIASVLKAQAGRIP